MPATLTSTRPSRTRPLPLLPEALPLGTPVVIARAMTPRSWMLGQRGVVDRTSVGPCRVQGQKLQPGMLVWVLLATGFRTPVLADQLDLILEGE